MAEDSVERRVERMERAAEQFAAGTFEELVSKSRNENEDVRMLSAARLLISDDPRAIPVLVALMDDSSPRVRAMAALGLGHYEAGETRSILIGCMRKDVSSDVRAICAASLGWIGGADKEIVRALDDTHPHVKVAAITALSRRGVSDAAGRITELLDDDDWSVRYFACAALLDFGISSPDVVKALEQLREIPEARASLTVFAQSDAVSEAANKFPREFDEFDDATPPSEFLAALREEHGEQAVPYPPSDPLADLIARANKLLRQTHP